jgi:hypothetical protein
MFSIANNYLYTSENNSVPAVVENISVDNLTCVRPYSPINGRRHFGLEIHGANNVKINGTIRESTVNSSETPLTMVGLQVEGCKNVDLDLHIYNVLMGSELGSQMIYGAGEHAQTTRNLKLKGRIHDTVYHGIGMYVMSDCDINCDVYNVGADRSLILWGYLATLSNINFKDCKLKKTVGVVAVDMNPGTYSKIRFDGCDFTGWTLINDMFRFEPDLSIADVDLIRVNCINLNYRNSMPTEGFFVKGEYVANLSPTVQGTAGSQYIVRGWNRMQTRNGDVLNVDWVEDRALIGL